MDILLKLSLTTELDEIANAVLSGSLPMMQRIEKVTRIDEIIKLLGANESTNQTDIAQPVDKLVNDLVAHFSNEHLESEIISLAEDGNSLMLQGYISQAMQQLNKTMPDGINANDLENAISAELQEKAPKTLFDLVQSKHKVAIKLKHNVIVRNKMTEFLNDLNSANPSLVSAIKSELSFKNGEKNLATRLFESLQKGVFVEYSQGGMFIDPWLKPQRKTWVFIEHLFNEKLLITGKSAIPPQVEHIGGDEDTIENGRDTFTLDRLRDGQNFKETFHRGEEVLLFNDGYNPTKVKITGISHADGKFKYDGMNHGIAFSYAYKLDYDYQTEPRERLESAVKSFENLDVIHSVNRPNEILNEFKRYTFLADELKIVEARLIQATIARNQNSQRLERERQEAEKQRIEAHKKDREETIIKNQQARPEFVEMTMAEWKKTHRDFKNIDAGQRYVMKFVAGIGSTMVPVKIIKEPTIIEQQDEVNAEFESEPENQLDEPPIDEVGAFYQSIIDGADIDIELVQKALSYAEIDDKHFLLSDAAQVIKDGVLKLAMES